VDDIILEKANLITRSTNETAKEKIMLYWTLVFLVIAMVAALFGFTGIYVAAAGIAKVLFFVFLVLLVVSLFAGGLRRGPPIA
jgi:uncharacterized membrane protein YtjA (UPF0391 family)